MRTSIVVIKIRQR